MRGTALETELAAEIEKLTAMRSAFQLSADTRSDEVDEQVRDSSLEGVL